MALASFATKAVSGLGLRCGLPALASRAYATVVDGLKYAKDHEWVKVEGDVATVGITDHAQSELGDVVYAEMPEVGASFSAGDRMAIVESVKAASDIISPVSGEIVAANEELSSDSSKINTDPYGEGWMVKVKLSNPEELKELMSAKEYEEFCA
ncbi:hypothetical protein COHA_000367 [Chlorella ohadii]|uniref:Glycine cleavage system H protein n=1 Tax=Chlorella ohadii TaxID=2649997 RepID=A0AAD5E0R2_9CHLO|nr:hypothetical protein COHA_000367 [Chlorella ohadii]